MITKCWDGYQPSSGERYNDKSKLELFSWAKLCKSCISQAQNILLLQHHSIISSYSTKTKYTSTSQHNSIGKSCRKYEKYTFTSAPFNTKKNVEKYTSISAPFANKWDKSNKF